MNLLKKQPKHFVLHIKPEILKLEFNKQETTFFTLGHFRFGFVPNGGRIYYLNRSQPPLLPLCVQAYYESTGDKEFVREMLPVLEKEQEFWDGNRAVAVKPNLDSPEIHQLFQYRADVRAPRPESYHEDMETAEEAAATTPAEKTRIYSHIASACESGWDFSSRWMNRSSHSGGSLKYEFF